MAFLVLISLVGILPSCGEAVRRERLTVRLGAKPERSVANHLNNEGEAAFVKTHELSIERRDGGLLEVRSEATFISVKNDVVTRVVYTPMSDTGDLVTATDSFKSLFGWFPKEQQETASEWVEKVRLDKDVVPDELSRHSTKFDLADDVEVYVEIRPLPDSGKWYTSVHLYAKADNAR